MYHLQPSLMRRELVASVVSAAEDPACIVAPSVWKVTRGIQLGRDWRGAGKRIVTLICLVGSRGMTQHTEAGDKVVLVGKVLDVGEWLVGPVPVLCWPREVVGC